MQFLNPLMLWGLAAASVPIIIHLLNRRRYQRQRWAAMEWLLAAVKKHQRRLRIESLLLLLLRTLAVLLLALALARPFLASAPVALAGAQATHLTLVVDNSASTGARNGLRTAFDEAIASATSLVDDLEGEAPVTLVVTNDNVNLHRPTGRPRLVLRESRDHDKVRRLLGELRPAPARADLVETLKIVDESLTGATTLQRKVAVVTDMQRATLASGAAPVAAPAGGAGDGGSEDGEDAAVATAGTGDRVTALLEALRDKDAEVLIVPVGTDTGNVAVVGLRPDLRRDVIQGARAAFLVEVVNHSDTRQRVELRFLVDGEERGDSVAWLELPPRPAGTSRPPARTHRFSVTFNDDEVGPHTVEARIPADAFPLDDSRSHAFEVRPRIRVLAVDGDPRPRRGGNGRQGGRRAETSWLAPALALRDGGPIEVMTADEGELRRLPNLDDYDMVVLANVARPAPDDATRAKLESFVRRGGSLLLTTGDNVTSAAWNDELWRDGDGLLPAPLGENVLRDDAWLQLDLSENRHPIMAELTHPSNVGLFQSPFMKGLTRTDEPDPARGARTVLRFTDLEKSPALLERRVGRGRVLLLTTTVDEDWGGLATSYVFPALLHEMVYVTTSRGNDARNLVTFQPFTREFPASLDRFELTYPDGTPARAEVEAPPDAPSYVVFRGTDRTGVYQTTTHFKAPDILAAAPPPEHGSFAVALTELESDLARMDVDEATARWPGLVTVADDLGEASETLQSRDAELSRWLLLSALLCLIAEVAVARHIGTRRTRA